MKSLDGILKRQQLSPSSVGSPGTGGIAFMAELRAWAAGASVARVILGWLCRLLRVPACGERWCGLWCWMLHVDNVTMKA